MELYFHTMKAELVHKTFFEDKIETVANKFEYIDFYNNERLHSSLRFQSPIEYENYVYEKCPRKRCEIKVHSSNINKV